MGSGLPVTVSSNARVSHRSELWIKEQVNKVQARQTLGKHAGGVCAQSWLCRALMWALTFCKCTGNKRTQYYSSCSIALCHFGHLQYVVWLSKQLKERPVC